MSLLFKKEYPTGRMVGIKVERRGRNAASIRWVLLRLEGRTGREWTKEEAVGVYPTKREAVDAAKGLARLHQVEGV